MRITATTVCRGKVQKVRAGRGATRSRTEGRATLESDPSADPEAGMAGERKRSPPPGVPSMFDSLEVKVLYPT